MEAIAAAVPAWEPEHPTAPDQAAEDERSAGKKTVLSLVVLAMPAAERFGFVHGCLAVVCCRRLCG